MREPVVLAMAEFRRHGFSDTTFGPATKLTARALRYEDIEVAVWKSYRDFISDHDAIFESQAKRSRYQTTQATKARASAERRCLPQSQYPCSQ